jgi:hypothetical protein
MFHARVSPVKAGRASVPPSGCGSISRDLPLATTHGAQAHCRTVPPRRRQPARRVCVRPKAEENPTGKYNFGGRLSAALALDAGALLTTDVEIVEQRVDLPEGEGTFDARLRVTGPVAFFVAKVHALRGRDKPKNA